MTRSTAAVRLGRPPATAPQQRRGHLAVVAPSCHLCPDLVPAVDAPVVYLETASHLGRRELRLCRPCHDGRPGRLTRELTYADFVWRGTGAVVPAAMPVAVPEPEPGPDARRP